MEVTREIVFPASPDEVWEALTDPEQLEEWFANDVELDVREGGDGVFRWDDGEERRAKVLVVEPRRAPRASTGTDEGEVEFTLEEVDEGTRLLVRESTPEFSTALELRALALDLRVTDPTGRVFDALADPEPPLRRSRRSRRARRRRRRSSPPSSR